MNVQEPTVEQATVKQPTVKQPAIEAKRQRHGLSFGFIALLLVALAAIGWFVYKGITSRVSAEKALVRETTESALLTVSVVHPKITTEARQLDLPGNTQALIDAPIYARTSGYLRKWYA